MDVPGGQVGQRARPEVLVFHPHGTSRTRRQNRMFAPSCLQARFLVGRDHEFIRPNGRPSQVLPDRSSMRPAFSENCGSRGKIQRGALVRREFFDDVSAVPESTSLSREERYPTAPIRASKIRHRIYEIEH